jgi:hypothetical protein
MFRMMFSKWDGSEPARMVCMSYEDALYLESVMIWVREHPPKGQETTKQFKQVELRLNMAVASPWGDNAMEKSREE